jgi:DNA polymerase-3 subunit beta
MKIKILTENLKVALNFLSKIIKKNPNFPILDNVLIDCDKNFLVLSTTDLQLSLTWWVLAKIEEKGKVLVPVEILYNLISLIKEEKIEIQEKNQNLIIETLTQKTRIQGQNYEDFPIIPTIQEKNENYVSLQKFCEALNSVISFAALSGVKPELSGIYIQFQKEKIKLAATDSFRLAEKTILLSDKEYIKKEGEIILPVETGKFLLNINSILKEEFLKIYFDSNQILFEVYNDEISHSIFHLQSRLIEGEYPKYQEIIPKKFILNTQVDKKIFTDALKTASIFTGKGNEVKLNFLKKQKQIKISAESPEKGGNESFISLYKIEGEEVEILFNYKFLLEGINNIQSSEVFFGISSKDGPALVKLIGDDSFFYILMPIKSF